MNKIALISGISGQDGSYLAEYLLKKKYHVIGLTRKIKKYKNLLNIDNKIKLIKTNYSYNHIKKILKKYKPKLIFNLTGQSSPSASWNNPGDTIYSIVNINLNFIESIKDCLPNTKYFNASTSEVFEDTNKRVNETTKFYPTNPYGCAKACSHFLVSVYRKKYKLFLVNGILFNHDSIRRGDEYLGKKIINTGILIKNKKKNFLKLKSTKLIRDFGYAKDYVRAIYSIMKLKKPEDFIIASGVSHSVFDYAKEVFRFMKIPITKIKDQNLLASDIKKISRADNKKIKKKTKWKPKYSFKKMILDFIKEENFNRSN